MASGGSKGLASSQGGNEVTGAFQTGGSVEQTKLNTPGMFWLHSRMCVAKTHVNTPLHARKFSASCCA